MFDHSFFAVLVLEIKTNKETLCNMASQAVIEQEADGKLVWARIPGMQGRATAERPGLAPTDR